MSTNLRIAYGSESLEGHFETQTIIANDSALMSTNPAVLGSPPAHLNSGEHDSRQENNSLNKPFISESFVSQF